MGPKLRYPAVHDTHIVCLLATAVAGRDAVAGRPAAAANTTRLPPAALCFAS